MNLPLIVTGLIVILFLIILTYFKIFRKPKKLEKIWELIQTGDTRNAMRMLKTQIIKHGGSVDAHYLLAECYKREGNSQMAVVEFRYCLKLKKKPYLTTERVIREGLVECYLKLHKDEEALGELFELSRMDPRNPEYLFEIAKIFFRKRNIEQAITYLDKTIKLNPTHAEALSYLGMMMFHANQIKEAIIYLTRAIRNNPRNYRAYYYLGRLHMDGRDFEKAIKYFDASQRSPDYRIRAFIQKGTCYREMNEFDSAVDEYRKAIAGSTGKEQNLFLAAKYSLADLYEARGKITEAIEQWESIYLIDPTYRDVSKKLDKYQDLRADDNMKDFLVSPLPVFEGICLDLVKHLGYDIIDIRHIKTSITNIIATPRSAMVRNIKIQRVFIKVYRDAISLGINAIKNLMEEAKAARCIKAICISPFNFKPEAVEFSATRQIELIGGNNLARLLREMSEE